MVATPDHKALEKARQMDCRLNGQHATGSVLLIMLNESEFEDKYGPMLRYRILEKTNSLGPIAQNCMYYYRSRKQSPFINLLEIPNSKYAIWPIIKRINWDRDPRWMGVRPVLPVRQVVP